MAANISKEGKSFRVRVQINGKRVSRSFPRLKDAKEWLSNYR